MKELEVLRGSVEDCEKNGFITKVDGKTSITAKGKCFFLAVRMNAPETDEQYFSLQKRFLKNWKTQQRTT